MDTNFSNKHSASVIKFEFTLLLKVGEQFYSETLVRTCDTAFNMVW